MGRDEMGGGSKVEEEEEKRIYTEILTFSFVLLSRVRTRVGTSKGSKLETRAVFWARNSSLSASEFFELSELFELTVLYPF